MELWKDIDGYNGAYQISNLGNIQRIKRRLSYSGGNGGRTIAEKLLAPVVGKTGYLAVFLTKNGKFYNHYIHRLVAAAFVPNPDNKRTVNHIDGDKSNNAADNLEWATHKENIKHAIDIGLRIYKTGADYPISKSVIQYDKTGQQVATFVSMLQAEELTGIDNSAIAKCCKGKRKSAGGFNWKYN